MRKVKLFSILVVSLLCLSSCGPTFPISVNINPDVKWNLWKIMDSDSTVYMLGSVHMADPAIYPLPSYISEAFTESDYLGIEYDLSNVSEDDMNRIREAVTYTDGTTIKDHVDEEAYTYINKVRPINSSELSYTISYLNSELTSELMNKVTNISYTDGVDSYLTNLAKDTDKDVVSIETLDTQLEILKGIGSDEYQTALLLSTAKMFEDPLKLKVALQDTFNMWASGDVDKMAEAVTDTSETPNEYKAYAEEAAALAITRNQQMAEKAAEFLNTEDNYFFVVGSAHYGGEYGILKLLESKGYEVTVVTDES